MVVGRNGFNLIWRRDENANGDAEKETKETEEHNRRVSALSKRERWD